MPTDLLNNLDYDGDSIRNIINGMNATLMYTNSNGEEITEELGIIDNIETYNLSSALSLNEDNDGDIPSFSGAGNSSLSLPPQSDYNTFSLRDSLWNTATRSNIETGRISTDNATVWERYSNGYIQPITSNTNDRLAELMEDYIRNRNQDDKIFINHNTCQREIEYNSIDDVIEFREYLDNIIKEHYQGR